MTDEKSLLLVVDVQNGFINEQTKHVVARINRLTAEWQKRQWPVVCSRFINIEGSPWERLRDWHELKGEPETLLSEDLRVDTPYIFKKSTYSAWSPETQQVAAVHKVQDIVIVGVDTNECVLATALAVFDSGLTPWVIEDCCASNGGSQVHDQTLTLLQALLGKQQVIKTHALLQD
jgi:nicotinamidase-related amidase